MKNVLEQNLQIRKGFYKILKNTPKETLLITPTGFNNNIWWNIAHVVATQQLLVYKLSGLPLVVTSEFVAKYKKGTAPNGSATNEEIELVKKLLFSTIEKTTEDYNNALFKNFNPYPTSAGLTLTNVEDAISFNFFHEGLHLGSIFALLRAVNI